jgi:hypothetical protein
VLVASCCYRRPITYWHVYASMPPPVSASVPHQCLPLCPTSVCLCAPPVSASVPHQCPHALELCLSLLTLELQQLDRF